MDVRQYLVEEVALDHADGLLSRREALRRLAQLGLGAGAAGALLAAAPEGASARAVRAASAPAQGGESAAAAAAPAARDITFAGPGGRRLLGAFAAARSPKGSILVVHENRGLTPHIRSVASRLAASGYSALAIDLLSEEGGTRAVGDEARIMAALAAAPRARFRADMRAGLAELGRRVPGKRSAAIGFCFGGGQVWNLIASGDRRLAAAIPFYGPAPDPADFSRSRAAVLAIYAGLDTRVNASRPRAAAALRKAGLTHRVRTFPGAEHAFFNSTGPRYNPRAARQAYAAVLDWLKAYVDLPAGRSPIQ
jgi:carboxymethylenebutenolidase